MRIGVSPAGRRDSATAVHIARLAEEHGFAEVWLSEDYLERGAFAVAGGIAAATSAVTIGIGVINPWTRHVAVAAMEAAALDELSRGRLILGLGASNERWMSDLLGIPFTRPISRLVEFADGLRTLLAGQRLTATIGGQHINAQLSYAPLRPDIPLYFGVKGPRALRMAGDAADGLMLSVLSPPEYVTWLRREYTPRSTTGYVAFALDADPAVARDRIRSRVAQFLGVHGSTPLTALGGLDPELASALRQRLIEGRDGADLVGDETLSRFAVAGTLRDCAAGLARFAESGLDSLIVMDDGYREFDRMVADIAAAAGAAGFLG